MEMDVPCADELWSRDACDVLRRTQLHAAVAYDVLKKVSVLNRYMANTVQPAIEGQSYGTVAQANRMKHKLEGYTVQLKQAVRTISRVHFGPWLRRRAAGLRTAFTRASQGNDAPGSNAEALFIWRKWQGSLHELRVNGKLYSELRELGAVMCTSFPPMGAAEFCVPSPTKKRKTAPQRRASDRAAGGGQVVTVESELTLNRRQRASAMPRSGTRASAGRFQTTDEKREEEKAREAAHREAEEEAEEAEVLSARRVAEEERRVAEEEALQQEEEEALQNEMRIQKEGEAREEAAWAQAEAAAAVSPE